MQKIKQFFNEKRLHSAILLLVIIQPLIDLDYLVFEFLDQFGLPRISTVIRFVIIPLLIIWSFLLRDQKKKRTFILTVVYGIVLLGYFIMHTRLAADLAVRLDFTDNFRFSLFKELIYILTLVLPYFVTYSIYHEHFEWKEFRGIVMVLSAVISIPIVFCDLYVCGQSTYYGMTVGNVFSWFSNIYEWYHPRTLAGKFYFSEGNTIGILLFMLLPLMYYFLASSEKKDRKKITVLIVIQSFAMQILATRVATYGAVAMPVIFVVLYLFDTLVMKHRKLEKDIFIICACTAVLFGALLQRTPAIQNQKVDAVNDTKLLSNGAVAFGEEELKNAEDLVPGSIEYINFYVYMFETYGINARYIQSVPSMYYTEYYNYQHDPKFWTDVTFMDVYDRVSGRQIETIFFNYKYKNLTRSEKFLGMGYSTFMNGSIVLEQDFKMQIYTLGYIGELLCVCPWLLIAFYGFIMFVLKWKKLLNLENLCMVTALGAGLGSAWLSGHMLDQFMTSVFMALIVGLLLNRVHEVKEKN